MQDLLNLMPPTPNRREISITPKIGDNTEEVELRVLDQLKHLHGWVWVIG
jgi:hypothetical protein